MVEEAVSYNELDYISVSAAWGGSVLTSLLAGLSGASQWGVFGGLSVLFDQQILATGTFRSVIPSNAASASTQLAPIFLWAAERLLSFSPRARSRVQPCFASPPPCPPPAFPNRSRVSQVGLDQQTVTLVCTNRRKQFLLDTADVALTE